MKRILIALTLVVALAGCTCPPEVAEGIDNVDETHDLILPDFLAYVKADPKLDDDQKDDRVKAVDTLRRLMASLKKAAGVD
jgi:hypothetical protein